MLTPIFRLKYIIFLFSLIILTVSSFGVSEAFADNLQAGSVHEKDLPTTDFIVNAYGLNSFDSKNNLEIVAICQLENPNNIDIFSMVVESISSNGESNILYFTEEKTKTKYFVFVTDGNDIILTCSGTNNTTEITHTDTQLFTPTFSLSHSPNPAIVGDALTISCNQNESLIQQVLPSKIQMTISSDGQTKSISGDEYVYDVTSEDPISVVCTTESLLDSRSTFPLIHIRYAETTIQPIDIDRDDDNLPNNLDMCPDIPEDFNGVDDWDGCPEIYSDVSETERVSIFARTFITSNGTPVTEASCNVHDDSTFFRMSVDYVYHDGSPSEQHFTSNDISDNETEVSLSDKYDIHVNCTVADAPSVNPAGAFKIVKPFHTISIDQTPIVGQNITITCKNDLDLSLAMQAVAVMKFERMIALEIVHNSTTANLIYNIPNTEKFLALCHAENVVLRDLTGSNYYLPVTMYITDSPVDDKPPKKGNGGCADCTPPTLGLNQNFKRIVDNGFTYNGISVNVIKWHTPYPLISATVGEMNLVEVKIYENGGISNIKRVQFGLGMAEIGIPLNSAEVIIDVQFHTNRTNTVGLTLDKISITDKDNLIDNDTISVDLATVKCQANDSMKKCLLVDLQYSYREAPLNNMLVVSASDKPRNNQNFYFNDGVQVLGESLNPSPTFSLYNKQTNQQTENLWLTLTRTDKVNDIWIDEFGIEYHKISDNRYDRITPAEPYQCNNAPLSEVNVPTRQNCNFRALLENMWNK